MASVQVLKPDPADKHKFVLDEGVLREILVANPTVRDNPVIVISVAGRYRTGKSFLLSLMHRYLSIQYKPTDVVVENGTKDEDFWAYVKEVTKAGFDWKGGCDAHTVGLWISKEPFLITLPSGEQANVFLMDTAGTFQTQASVRECGTVFGLATLISSLLVYNIMNNVGEDDLHNLHLFAECGKMAAEKNTQQPFQKLLFLVRDWIDGRRFPFGSEGGSTFLKKVLEEEEGDKAPDEVNYVRQFLKASFQELDCFLLPRPGDEVADAVSLQECNFDAVKPTFKENILTLIQKILDPSNLIIKETIPGCSVNGQQMFLMFQRYLGAYNNALPEDVLSSVVQITSMLQHEAAKAKAFQAFTEGAKKIEVILRKYKTMEELDEALDPVIHFSLDKLQSAPKIGDETITSRYISELRERMEEVTGALKDEMKIIILVNDSKEKYAEAMKPIVDDLVSVENESALVQAHSKIHDKLINTFDEEEVSKTKCLELCMRYRSELIDWMSRQIQELNRTLKSHHTAVKFSLDKYRDLIAQLKDGIDNIQCEEEFLKKLDRFKELSIGVFDDFDKGGTEDVSMTFKDTMLKQMVPETKEVEALVKHVILYNLHTESHNKDMTKVKIELTKLDTESLKKTCCKLHLDTLSKFDEKLASLEGGDEMHAKYRDKLVAWINDQTNAAVEILESHSEAVDEAIKCLNKEIDYIQAAMADYTENQFYTRTSFLSNGITKLFNKFKKREDKIATVQFLDLLDVKIEERVEKLILERKHIFKVNEAKVIYQQHLEKLKYELIQFENEEELISRHDECVKQTLTIYDIFMAEDVELHKHYHSQMEKWLKEQLEELLLIRDSHRNAQNAALFFFVEAIKEAETSLDRVLSSYIELQFKLERIKSDALTTFDSAEKRGEPEIAAQYRKQVKATMAVSVDAVTAKHQHISAHGSSLKSFQDGMVRLQIRMAHFKTMEELEAAYKAHEEQALTQFLSGCPEGDYKDYSDKYSTDLINEMTLAWNDISYEMQCLMAKRDGENFCEKAVESIKEQIKNIKIQKDLEKLLKPVKQKTDLLYKGIEKAAKTEKSVEVYNRYDTELEDFIGQNFKKLGQSYKDHQLLKESMQGAVEKYRKLLEPPMRKSWIDVADHAEDFAMAERLALSAFDEISATAEIERDLEVPHDLKMEYMEELKEKLKVESEDFQNQRYRNNFYNGVIVTCGVFIVSATCFSLETIVSLILIAICLGGGYLYINKHNQARTKSKTKSTEEKTVSKKRESVKETAKPAESSSGKSADKIVPPTQPAEIPANIGASATTSELKDKEPITVAPAQVQEPSSSKRSDTGEDEIKVGPESGDSKSAALKQEESKEKRKTVIDDILPD